MRKKPLFYEAACIFSMIGSSLGFVSMFVASLFFTPVTEKIRQFTNMRATEHLSQFYFALLMTAFAVSLSGAIQLYRMQRRGLYFYLPAQAIVLFLPVYWLGSNAFSVSNAIFTVIFSGVYLYHHGGMAKGLDG